VRLIQAAAGSMGRRLWGTKDARHKFLLFPFKQNLDGLNEKPAAEISRGWRRSARAVEAWCAAQIARGWAGGIKKPRGKRARGWLFH